MKTTRDCHYMGEGEGLRDKRSETKSAGAVSTCSNSFGVLLEEARLRERERDEEREAGSRTKAIKGFSGEEMCGQNQ